MSTFNHSGLINDINASLAPFRKAQPEAMAGFGQLARAASVRATRLAHGVPLGGELEFIDRGTLAHAFGGRQSLA